MWSESLWSGLFVAPFLTGLCLALLLPVLGCYLRLRDEWLAALSYAHVAAAGALLALPFGLPPLLGGGLAAVAVGFGKYALARRLAGGAAYPLLLLAGWGIAILMAANLPLAERLGHALFDGQLYFADGVQLSGIVVWAVLAALLLRQLSRHLLLSHVYPDFFRLRGLRRWPVQTGFDVLAALSLAVATMSLGVMGAFALVFVPPWLAFRRAANWRRGLLLAVLIGLAAYVSAFALALTFDQPFGPVLALLLVFSALIFA
jgi:zinc transport system permease protein